MYVSKLKRRSGRPAEDGGGRPSDLGLRPRAACHKGPAGRGQAASRNSGTIFPVLPGAWQQSSSTIIIFHNNHIADKMDSRFRGNDTIHRVRSLITEFFFSSRSSRLPGVTKVRIKTKCSRRVRQAYIELFCTIHGSTGSPRTRWQERVPTTAY
jgi:hypothetical protein